jgi:hypothetical protein
MNRVLLASRASATRRLLIHIAAALLPAMIVTAE